MTCESWGRVLVWCDSDFKILETVQDTGIPLRSPDLYLLFGLGQSCEGGVMNDMSQLHFLSRSQISRWSSQHNCKISRQDHHQDVSSVHSTGYLLLMLALFDQVLKKIENSNDQSLCSRLILNVLLPAWLSANSAILHPCSSGWKTCCCFLRVCLRSGILPTGGLVLHRYFRCSLVLVSSVSSRLSPCALWRLCGLLI